MSKKQKKLLWRILAAGGLFAAALTVNLTLRPVWWAGVLLMLLPYLTVGFDVLFSAAAKISKGKVFDEHFLMTVASLGAILLCLVEKDAHNAHEAVVILLFYQVGELFQSVAVGRSRRSLKDLLSMMPDYAGIEKDGQILQVDPEEIEVGQEIVILPGEKVPLDGVILSGCSALDTASLTGESLPKEVKEGDLILSGCINGEGTLRVKVTKPAGESTVSKIMELVENAGLHKSKSENFISVFARRYTPIVTGLALFLALIPPLLVGLFSGDWSFEHTFYPFVHAALMFLIVSCPCALVISVPLSFFGGIGGASKKGILVKGSGYLETLAKCKTAVFDKTGTLTEGHFTVTGIYPAKGVEPEELILLAASAEQYSTHPLAQAVKKAAAGKSLYLIKEHRNLAGKGIEAHTENDTVYVGNRLLMGELSLDVPAFLGEGSALYICKNQRYMGAVLAADSVKDDAQASLAALSKMGIKTVMLTGDRRENAAATAERLGLARYEAELLPADKVSLTRELLKEDGKGSLCYVGDGINDAPVLALADVGVAMGALGSDAAIEAADLVLMNDRLSDFVTALRIAKKTVRIVKQNIVLAIGVKVGVMILLALMSVLPPLAPLAGFAGTFAVFADVGVSVIAILNAMRAMKI